MKANICVCGTNGTNYMHTPPPPPPVHVFILKLQLTLPIANGLVNQRNTGGERNGRIHAVLGCKASTVDAPDADLPDAYFCLDTALAEAGVDVLLLGGEELCLATDEAKRNR